MSTLEAERDFLLKSLDDLEAEYAAGGIDAETYQRLHDDYTARAAAVIRSLRDGITVVESEPSAAKSPTWMRVVTIGGLVVFALLAAYALTKAVGTRDPGETITGNTNQDRDTIEVLRTAAESRPDDYDAQIAYARAQLGNDLPEALRYYDAAYRLDRTQPEPATYIGWINGLAAQQLPAGEDRDALVESAFEWLDRAIELDDTYEDAYVFRALVHSNVLGDAEAAVPDFQMFLANAPADHPMRPTVNAALAEALEESNATTTTPGGP